MGIFLRLKHWQIFILTFGLFILVWIFVTISDFSQLFGSDDGTSFLRATTNFTLRLILLIQTICLICANFWRYAIGTRLHKKHYYNSFMLLIFRWSLYFSTLANTARFVVFPSIGFFDGEFNNLVTVLSLLGGIYCDYFAARLLNSVEQQRNVSFREFSGDFFAFIFYPIGVWWLQPRINRIFGRNEEVYDPNAPLDQHVTN